MEGNEVVESFSYKGHEVEVLGCWDSETEENEFDFYDIFVDGDCVNLGEPFYKRPSLRKVKQIVATYLELWTGGK